MNPRSFRIGYLAAAALPALLVLAWVVVHPGAFNQWDNHELFTPVVWQSQTQLMAGDFPHWTHTQHMGQPIHAFGQYGVLYPLYTVAVGIAQVTGLGPARLADIITIMHAALAGFMLFGLCRRLRAPTWLAIAAALSAVCGGYQLYHTSCLFFTMPYLAWTAAAMWAVIAVIDSRRVARACIALIMALTMIAHLGHAQFTLYSAMTVAAFTACYLTHRKRWKPKAASLAIAACAAALLAMPTILPNWSILADTGRSDAVSLEAFGAHGIPLAAMKGMILPALHGEDGFTKETTLYTVAGGAWCLPAIIAGLLIGRPRNRVDRHLLLLTAAITVLAIFFLLLSMGEHNPLYKLTYHIPVWSRLRWPYKWITFALPLLTVAGVLSVTRITLGAVPRRSIAFLCAWTIGSLVMYGLDGDHSSWAIAASLAGLGCVVTLTLSRRPAVRQGFVVLVLIESLAVLAMSQHDDRYKAYHDQAYNPEWASQFDIDTDYRVMPGSPSNPPGRYLNELGLFEVATLDGYRSLTGGRWALTSSLLESYLPCHGEGHFPRQMLASLLRSHLLRSYNTRYVVAHVDDAPLLEFLDNSPQWRLHSASGVTRIYANDDALPRAYFATHLEPGDDQHMHAGMINNQAPLRTAFVVGASSAPALPPATVQATDWQANRVRLRVDAPDGGVLVVSMCYNPRWQAMFDGQYAPIQRTNGAIMSIAVPSGASVIELQYIDPAFHRGLWCAMAGALILCGFAVVGLRRR